MGGAVGLVVVSLVGLGLNGTQTEKHAPAAGRHRLTVPTGLLDSRYRLTRDLTGTGGEKMRKRIGAGTREDRVSGVVVGEYGEKSDPDADLVLSGVYGHFAYIEAMRHGMLHGAIQGGAVTVTVPPKGFFETGSPTVTREALTRKQTKYGVDVTYPVCAWADADTSGLVIAMDSKAVGADPFDVDLRSYAEPTRQVRSEIIEPTG